MLLRLALLISSKYSLITNLIYTLLLRYFFHLLLLFMYMYVHYLQRRPRTQIEVCSGNKIFDDTTVKLYDCTIVIIYLC